MTATQPAFEANVFKVRAAARAADAAGAAKVRRAQTLLVERRAAARAAEPAFEAMRAHAAALKDAALSQLPELLAAFEAQVIARGGHVHWARDAAEARAIVLDLCRKAKAQRVVKSKSMVTEEIDLAPALEAAGFHTLETDLGEYIIQLRHERPSHLILPALHLSQDEIAETFREAHPDLPRDRDLSRRALVREARAKLREAFRTAEVGITGANFLVAETGSLVLVTNEGNADLTATLPDTHIVVTGIEKAVPTFADAAHLVRLLAKSATGQPVTAYTSMFTGPARPGEEGPKHFHVVLVDNGRSDMLGSEFQPMLRCIRCGACLNHCPIYGAVGGHSYGSVYGGPMGAVLTPAVAGLKAAADLPNASTFCGRCEEVCPVKIPLPGLMRHWREREFSRHMQPRIAGVALAGWRFVASRPWLYALGSRLGAMALRLFSARGHVRKLPGVTDSWMTGRELMAPPPGGTFQARWAKRRDR